MDDVVLFGKGTFEEWRVFITIIDTFLVASGMLVSLEKSSFLKHNLDDNLVVSISSIFPFSMEPIEIDFKYLGFWIKPLNYCVEDSKWLVQKFNKRASN